MRVKIITRGDREPSTLSLPPSLSQIYKSVAFNFAGRLGNPSRDPDHFGGSTDAGAFITRRIPTRPRLMRCRRGGSEVGSFQRPPFIAAACLRQDPNPTHSAKAEAEAEAKASVQMLQSNAGVHGLGVDGSCSTRQASVIIASVGLVELLGNSMPRLVLLLIIAPNSSVSWTRREK